MKAIISCLVLITVSSAVSQTLSGVISGQATDETLAPIAGARLLWQGTSLGTVTRIDGSFTLERPARVADADTLIISAIGYRSDTLVVSRTTEHINHTLKAEYYARPIEVEGQATAIAAAEPIRTELITRRQLEQSACCTLAESFERSPSVEVQMSDAVLGAKTIRLLGLRGIYTTGLIEAVPLMRGVTSAFALDDIPGPFLDCISISKGAASVLNGYDGVTGQINVEFRKPNRDVPFFANGFANHLGRAELNLTSAGQLAENLHTMIMLHGRTFQRNVDANRDGFIDMPRFGNFNGIARMLWQEGNWEAQVMLRPTWGNYLSGSMPSLSTDLKEYRIETSTRRYEGLAKISYNEFANPLADRIGIQIALTRQELNTRAGLRKITAEETSALAKVLVAIDPEESLKLVYGASFLYDEPREQLDSLRRSRLEIVPGVFIEATWSPIPMVTATIGFRSDWHNLFGNQLTPRMHIKYNFSELVTLRFSAGTGMRVPLMLTDNTAAFLNNRRINIDTRLLPERAVNLGGSITATIPIGDRAITLDGEFYHTYFSRQFVNDFDRSARELALVYVDQAYANSALAQLATTLLPRLELTIAYRLMDTHALTGGLLRLQPLISPHRVLAMATYTTGDRVWEFNTTIVWYSSGRIPTTQDNPAEYRFPERFPPYVRAGIHINYRPEYLPEFYIGMENIANVLQSRAVLAPESPHSPFFDATLVWGVLEQRTLYAGIRWSLQ